MSTTLTNGKGREENYKKREDGERWERAQTERADMEEARVKETAEADTKRADREEARVQETAEAGDISAT